MTPLRESVSDEELRRQEHMRAIGSKGGLAKVPKGFARMDEEKQRAASKLGGQVAGSLKIPKGFARMSEEKAREIRAMRGKDKSVEGGKS